MSAFDAVMNSERKGSSNGIRQTSGRAGYSLVEISLALLVVAVGFLAALALLPEGLNQARRSAQEAETAAFAEYVFASLALESADTNLEWDASFRAPLQLMQSHSLQIQGQPLAAVVAGFNAVSNYWWIPNFYGDAALKIAQYRTANFTYNLTIERVPQRDTRYARLEVWPGEYAVRPAWPGKVFYREYLASHEK